MYNKLSKRVRIKIKRLSNENIISSKLYIKHTNSKVIITLYIINNKQFIFRNKVINLLKRKRIKLVYKFIIKINTLYKNFMIRNGNKYLKNANIIIYYLLLKNKPLFNYLKKILYFNQVLYIELRKTNNLYINFKALGIIEIIKAIYHKDVEMDIVNQKTLYLNSDILSNFMDFIIKKRKYTIASILKSLISIVQLPPKYLYLINNNNTNNLKSNTLECLKYKSISGIKLEGAGRLTKRLTAARSVYNTRIKGSLQNIDSSYKGISAHISRGHLRSNLQVTKMNSKIRNGAFGLKC